MACVFIELGQDVHINGNLDEAVNEGVRRGYEKATCAVHYRGPLAAR